MEQDDWVSHRIGTGRFVKVVHACVTPKPDQMPPEVGAGTIWECDCDRVWVYNPPRGSMIFIGHRHWVTEDEWRRLQAEMLQAKNGPA